MNKIIRIKYSYINESGTNIFGEMLLPYINNMLFKPFKIYVSSGQIDINHRKLKGIGGKKYRDIKDLIIKKYFKKISYESNLLKVITEFQVPMDSPFGMVKIISIFNGYSSNREGKLFIEDNIPELKGKKVAKLFQNLKSYSGEVDNLQVFNLSEVKNDEYIKALINLHEVNIKSSTTVEVNNG